MARGLAPLHPGDENKALPVLAYVLFFLGLFHGVTILFALAIAYTSRGRAGERMASHHRWIIETFWLCLGLGLIGLLLAAIGSVAPRPLPLLGGLVLPGMVLVGIAWLLCAERLIRGAFRALAAEEIS